jgi:2-polyprenyl-6-methoxyphenol hydroxylase-like FAD-dependent oxidoreductase
MRVLISGAGIAGLTAAFWLRRYGFAPTIVERAPSLVIGGYKIDVRGTALQVLRRMGIYDAVVAARTDMQGALLVDKGGKVINEMSGDAFGHRAGEDIEIVRGTLCQILMDHNSEAEFIFDDSIRSISQSSDSVRVELTRNSSREFDLVIGADGLHSNVRGLVFGDETRFVHELGLYLCVYTVPNHLHLDRLEIQYSELGRVAAIWSSRGDANAKACFGFAAPSVQIDLRDKAQQQQVLKNVYDGIGWEFPRLLELMPSAPDFYFDAAAQIRMAQWSQGRVALAGDAGYCASPMSGQGTSLALIGAYVLAGELAAASGAYQTAFQKYEREMRPFVALNQELAVRSAKLMRPKEKHVFTWLLEQIMRIAPGRMIEFFIDRSTRRIQHAANAITLNRTRCKSPELRRAKIRARARPARYFRLALLEERKHLLLARATDRPVCLNFAIVPST